MITNPFIYLFILSFIATGFYVLESKTKFKIFTLIPGVVMIYASSMVLASFNLFEMNDEINEIYKRVKSNLLPAMLFLMLLQIDFRHFLKLGKSLLISYVLAVFSIAFSFIVVAFIFDFSPEISGAFGALAGSWMGGTANMVAVGSALEVSEASFAYALVVDSVNYTLWVMLLLFLVPFAHIFNRFTKSEQNLEYLGEIGCSCTIGAKRYWLFILLSLVVAFIVNLIALSEFKILNSTTTAVLLATLLGILGSFTKLKEINGSSEVATTMLYLLIALIGSKAVIDNFSGIGIYVFAGFMILSLHALIMIIGAKLFKLDLFSIAVASLSNIGGVASAPILAAAYNKSLVSIGVLMAIMGYLIGTFGGLGVGTILIRMAQ
ncbi:DUF819 family protein [Sulfurimonas aquatica]|uniref:DUF819 family protein n=1 Tax=Sulfurimonas aquatica TaxID=2672570 RepID=A0A975GC78_9BACT|nr:DUF819 family protein [Sulfurimonas aquatica]QSZ40989.1 DUF819 family protein [Sulfurimonas aquatica]